MRTSVSHPLQIAELDFGGYGKIGVTFCPGKKQPGALTGAWDRDLDLDLDAIDEWNAAIVVTLLEEHEFAKLGVPDLGRHIADRGMTWHHLPIRDVNVPDGKFELAWDRLSEGLQAVLVDGFNVLFHCKGGLGRAGMMAARLAVELGMKPRTAITQIRAVRPGAIETPAQLDYVLRQNKAPPVIPEDHAAAIEDRALGAMLGLAVGDALGTTLEFKPRGSFPRVQDMVGGGPFKLQPGEWTDDTAMALALIDSLLHASNLDEADLMTRFVDWRKNGTYSCTGHCFDIGMTVSGALKRWQETGDPIAGSTDPRSAGNGSLMRLAPVAIRHWRNRARLRDVAARQSRTTHGALEAVDACVAFAEAIADAIAGEMRSKVLQPLHTDYAGKIGPIMEGAWRGKRRDEIGSSGYVAHSLEAALWCVGRTATFEDAVLLAANLGEDADTTAAITGQLAGALYGAKGIPKEWLEKLAWRDRIETMTRSLIACAFAEEPFEEDGEND